MTETVQLLSDRVLVRMDNAEKQQNGIVLPGSPQRDDEAFYHGTVIACGPGDTDKRGVFHPVSVAPGDRVLVYWFAVQDGKGHGGPKGPLSSNARLAGFQYGPKGDVIIRESDISAVLYG